ncbi:MAG: hypothetical protein OXM87_09315 [Truepera sp.]|nr:hypothetical protein [Truepera sp.]
MSDTPSEFSGFEPSANPLQSRLAEVEDHTLTFPVGFGAAHGDGAGG